MDARINQIGEEAGPHVTLKELREKRKELEKLPPPEKKTKFDSWIAEKEKELKVKMKLFAQGMTQGIPAETWSVELLLSHLENNLNKEQVKVMWPAVMLQYLPLMGEVMESVVYTKESQEWNTRLQGIDNSIAVMTSTLPKPFEPSMINKDPRFPVERCGQTSDGEWFDRWLQDGLKEKKLVLFKQQEKYIEYLIRYYYEVYWATAERERGEAGKKATSPVEEKPAPQPEPLSPAISEFFQMGEDRFLDDELTPGGRRKSAIYK